MESLKPVQIEMPAPADEATLLAFYLEGVPLVQIARALQVPVQTILNFIRTEDSRAAIRDYEESIQHQTRLFALASRIPAMSTLREVCASEGSSAERRRAASDLLRQSRAAEKPAKGKLFTRTAHSTPNPESLLPNPNIKPPPEVTLRARPHQPSALSPDSQRDELAPAPIANTAAHDQLESQPAAQASDEARAPVHRSCTAHEHTASWHAFDHADLDAIASAHAPAAATNPVPSTSPPAELPLATSQAHSQFAQPIEHPAANPASAPESASPTNSRIASSFDLINPGELSNPLPDAVPVAA
ncbi:MAG: hypothetical protein ACREJD_13715 [Phycisphaerales bacterium]